MSLKKRDLVDKIYKNNKEVSKKNIFDIVETLFSIISDEIIDGEVVHIEKFGEFMVITRNERIGYSPTKKANVVFPEKRSVKFKPSRYLNKKVNDK